MALAFQMMSTMPVLPPSSFSTHGALPLRAPAAVGAEHHRSHTRLHLETQLAHAWGIDDFCRRLQTLSQAADKPESQGNNYGKSVIVLTVLQGT